MFGAQGAFNYSSVIALEKIESIVNFRSTPQRLALDSNFEIFRRSVSAVSKSKFGFDDRPFYTRDIVDAHPFLALAFRSPFFDLRKVNSFEMDGGTW